MLSGCATGELSDGPGGCVCGGSHLCGPGCHRPQAAPDQARAQIHHAGDISRFPSVPIDLGKRLNSSHHDNNDCSSFVINVPMLTAKHVRWRNMPQL